MRVGMDSIILADRIAVQEEEEGIRMALTTTPLLDKIPITLLTPTTPLDRRTTFAYRSPEEEEEGQRDR